MELKNYSLFVVLPVDEVTIEDDTLIHCNMFKGNRDKFVLKHIANKRDLQEVETVLAPRAGMVITRSDLIHYMYRFWEKISLMEGEFDAEQYIYDYVQRDGNVVEPYGIKGQAIPGVAPEPMDANPFVEQHPKPKIDDDLAVFWGGGEIMVKELPDALPVVQIKLHGLVEKPFHGQIFEWLNTHHINFHGTWKKLPK